MNRAKDRGKAHYNNDLDKITWKEYQEGGVTESKVGFNLNNTLHFILSHRSEISTAALPNLEEDAECKGRGCVVGKNDQCLQLTLSEGDSLIQHVHFCNKCTR